MKKRTISCAVLSACLLFGGATAAMAETPAPNLVAHYTFADASNVGKDSAGSDDMTVVSASLQEDAGLAKVVDGPDGMKALEFDQSYALRTDADDVLDGLKEFTITYLVAANDAGELKYNMFSTGLGNGNNIQNSGINALMDFAKDESVRTGSPDVRLYGSENVGEKWTADQRKNDDGKNGRSFWIDRIGGDIDAPVPTSYAAGEWYRIVITVKLSDGTKTSEEQQLWPNGNQGDAFYPGTGTQSVYIEKMDGIQAKSDLVESQNFYETVLPYDLTSIKNEKYGLTLGAAYDVGKDAFNTSAGANYSMFIGKMADFRIYDKALTQDQIVSLFQNNELTDTSGQEDDTTPVTKPQTPATPSGDGNPSTGVETSLLPFLALIPAAAVVGVLAVRRRKAEK
ncbi:MAG TPA: LamG domain-containing protein [Firmicutes bacterium]|nr:LamG domain-containing protein [Bacillota bacterium]